jgi:glutathione synthase/RimK-type ligase-like ATP-grasp enzyme
MDVNLRIAEQGSETGALLMQYLRGRGVKHNIAAPNIVSYGIHIPERDGFRILNSNAGRGKVRAMALMRSAGVQTVPLYLAKELLALKPKELENLTYPMFARMNHGFGAKDIGLILQPEEVAWRIAAGWEWFSTYIPTKAEQRIWIYQDDHLDTYEKQMKRPSEYKGLGRNFGQGFEFVHVEPHKAAVREATNAVAAVGLDFAAVDVLIGKDDQPYVLEANTAPGVIRSGCQATLGKLADRIVEWAK